MRVLFASSEIYPLAKTGGLADVSAALPRALAALGIDVQLLLPGYPTAIEATVNKAVEAEFADLLGAGPVRLISGRVPDTRLPIWLVDCPTLFRRGGSPYQDQDGRDWADNARRFALFSHVAARLAHGRLLRNWRADIVHANDWHTGLVPAILAGVRGARPSTVLTIHNLAFQGLFPASAYSELDLRGDGIVRDGMEFYGQISFLKAGIRHSDKLTTVSPTYAKQILTHEYGCGLEGLLQSRVRDLVGILNGVDYGVWDPRTDAYVIANFNSPNIGGKRACKAALQEELGMEVDPTTALVVYISRITDQKMADIVLAALPEIIEGGVQFALLGEGDRALEREFATAAARYPGRIVTRIGYSEPFAHRLLAGADILLHPSRFEPCGLTQLYAMRYGTLPVVRGTGGLSDTVVDATEAAISAGTATGFAFEGATTIEMLRCLRRAMALYRQPLAWRKIQRQAMAQNFGWAESAQRYLALYRTLAPHAMEVAEPVNADGSCEKATG